MACRAPWAVTIAREQGGNRRILHSGCDVVDGAVQCSPDTLRAAASHLLGRSISRDAYTLARYTSSEHGSGTPEEKALLAVLARRQAARRGVSVYQLLACTNNLGTCTYGPIHATVDGGLTAPYGRWAATSRDPGVDDVMIAELALSGALDGFGNGADDQREGYPSSFTNGVETYLRRQAMAGTFWVGPIPGVNPLEILAFKKIALDPASAEANIGAALAAVMSPPPVWNWDGLCPTPGRVNPLLVASGLIVVAGIIGLGIAKFTGTPILDRGA